MGFSRSPGGLTPYAAALTGASSLFTATTKDERARVAILVTDGEPTDRDPAGVAAQAASLRSQGIDVITVFITGPESRGARRANHTAQMQQIEAAQRPGHWYDPSQYADFSTYVQALIGNDGGQNLAETVSSSVVTVEDAAELTATFLGIIKTKAIACTR